MVLATRLLAAAGGAGSFTPTPPPLAWISVADLLTMIAGGFTKAGGNPVLPKGTAGQWDDWAVREFGPAIGETGLMVTESDGIWAYYWGRPDGSTGSFQIGLAKSADAGATWTRYGSNPILTPSGTAGHWYESHIYQSSVVKENTGRRVMLAVGRDGSGTEKFGCLTSTDGLAWTDEGANLGLADFSDGGAVDQLGVPTLIKRSGGDWLFLCECIKVGVTNGWRIFGATANDPTGTWTPLNSGQPLLSPTGAGWESVGVANPQIIENEPGAYAMLYNGISAVTGWQIGFAYSSDLTTWTRYGSNPILTKGAGGQWDDQQVETSFLPKEPTRGSLRFYYQGYSAADGSTQIGAAETP